MNDSLYLAAVRLTVGAGIASTSLLRACCQISYVEAVTLIDRMEADGIVGSHDTSGPRTTLTRSVPMQLQQSFDARQVEPASFPPPPVLADYHVRIVESEAKPTSDQSGGFVEFTLEILDPGTYQGRRVPYRLNLFNKSQQTVEISYRQLSALCWVTGVLQIQDTRQLHGIDFIANIGPQVGNPQYSNVFNVKDRNGNLPGKAGAGAVGGAPVAAVPAPAAPPAWQPPAASAAPPPAWGAPPAQPAAPPAAPPAWGPPPPAAAPAPAWQPPAPAAAAPPAWGAPQPQPGAQPAPAWAPAGAPPAAPPWAR